MNDPAVGVFVWGLEIEDFLEPNGLTLDVFCREFSGSWVFAYADALRRAGAAPVIFLVSRHVDDVLETVHEPTGAAVRVLPSPRTYRLARGRMRHPYGRNVRQAFGSRAARAYPLVPLLAATKEVAPYLSTPVRALRRELRASRCAALVCQEYEFPRFDVCVALQRYLGVPVFGVFQGGDYRRWRAERVTRPYAVARAAGLIAGPRDELRRVRSLYAVPSDRLVQIFNPVDTSVWRPGDRLLARRELGIPEETPVAAWHGRVEVVKKGLDILVDAWARVTRVHAPDARLLLLGDGGGSADLQTRLEAEGLMNVHWVKRLESDRARLAAQLAAADVYVFPSRYEGFPLAPIEAMACGLPVVATRASGLADIVGEEDDRGGVLVPPQAAGALAAETAALLGDPARRRSMGAVARRRAEELFSLDVVGAKLRAFLLDPPGAAVARSV